MIDDKINSSLKEIEKELQNLSSARSQVDRTVASYEELKKATSSYTKNLSTIKDNLTGLVRVLREDYVNIISDFKKQQKDIESKTSEAIESLTEASENVQKSVNDNIKSINQKLILSLVLNAVLIAVVICLNLSKILHFVR